METELDQILQERAFLLAKKPAKDDACDLNCTTMLQIGLSGRSYCIEASFVEEILTVDSVVPVPGAVNSVKGIVNVRGKIVAIVDLSVLFEIQNSGHAPMRVVVIKDRSSGMEFGILVDEIAQTLFLKDEEIKELPSNITGISREYLSGVTLSGLIIINTKQLINMTSMKVTNTNNKEERL